MTPEVAPEVTPEVVGFTPEVGTPEVSCARARPPYGRGPNFGVRGSSPPETTPEDLGSAPLPPNFGGSVWPYGTGGRCGEVFAAARAEALADIERLGMAGALERWERAGKIGPATRQVLTPADIDAMQRAFIGGVP